VTAYDLVCQRLLEVTGHPVRNGSALCPAHDDHNPSLSVNQGTEGVVLHCFAGCATPDVVAALKLTMADLFDKPRSTGRHRRILRTHPYGDEDGTLLYETVRFDGTGNDRFRQRRPDGKGGWIWNIEDTRKVLYQLPLVLEAIEAGGPILLSEGEHDADALTRAGAVATTNPLGAANWLPEYTKTLAGTKVAMVIDRDDTGRKRAVTLVPELEAAGCTIVGVYEPVKGKDAAEVLGMGYDLDTGFVDVTDDIGEPARDPQTDDFWTARPELEHIRTYAQAQMASPLAVLAMVLARVVCQTPIAVVLPDIIHDHASLNLTIALVGISGSGKGGATGVARRAVNIGTPNFNTHTLGSGQGIAHGYGHWEKPSKDEPGRVVRHADSVLFTVEEVDHIAGHNAQNGSTTLAEQRRFSMGEKLGHLYVDHIRRVEIGAHTYRGAIVVSVQPARAGVLLDAVEGGTPQRFWWIPTIDTNPPDTEPARPTPWQWQPPSADELPPVERFTGLRPIPVCETARTAIRDAQRARNRGEGDPLDGHALLTRERIAAALGLLHGHYGITDEDWTLAGTLTAVSDATRAGVVATLEAKTRTVNVARAHAEADRDEVKEDRQDQRVARRLLAILRREGDWVNGADLRRRLTSRDRVALESAVANLIAAGQAESEPIPQDTPTSRPGTRYRAVEQ
jgi:hypothetical protein